MADPTLPPEAPRVRLNPSWPGVTGQSITVPAGGSLQAAIDAYRDGDCLVLDNGADYLGNFVVGAGKGLVIRSNQELGPPARLVSPNSDPALRVQAGSRRVYAKGLAFTSQPGAALGALCWFIVYIDPTGATKPEELATDITFDGCTIDGGPNLRTLSGLRADGNRVAFINGSILNIHYDGFDSQAFCSTTGAGPFLIRNSRLEGAGENVMFGGADPAFPNLVPSDIELDKVVLYKPLSWKVGDPNYAGIPWTVKNLFELKNARRVHVHDCRMENNWQHAQTGFAILLTPRNQGGFAPWSCVEDVLIENTQVWGSDSGITLQNADETKAAGSRRIALQNLLIAGTRWTGLNIASGPDDLLIDHVTVIPNNYLAWSGAAPGLRTIVQNSIFGYGSFGGEAGFIQGATTQKNAFVLFPGDLGDGMGNLRIAASYYGDPSGVWAGFKAYQTPEAAGLSPAGVLSVTSPLKGTATDGKDIGYIEVISAPTPPPVPPPTPTPPPPTPHPDPTPPPTPPPPTPTLEQRIAALEAWRAAVKAAS